MSANRKATVERRWSRKPLIESDGTTSIPAYYGSDIDEEDNVLFARCPFCRELNDDHDVVIGETYRRKRSGVCKHFVKLIGGCGAYAFVFKQPKE